MLWLEKEKILEKNKKKNIFLITHSCLSFCFYWDLGPKPLFDYPWNKMAHGLCQACGYFFNTCISITSSIIALSLLMKNKCHFKSEFTSL